MHGETLKFPEDGLWTTKVCRKDFVNKYNTETFVVVANYTA